MSRSRFIAIFCILVTGLSCATTSTGCDRNAPLTATETAPPERVSIDELLEVARPSASEDVLYRPPSLEERLRLERALEPVLASLTSNEAVSAEALAEFDGSGLRAELLDDGKFLILRVAGDRWRGAGVYVFRVGQADPILLQAPHGYHDRHTADIGWSAFRRAGVRAFYFNTVHRYRAAPGSRGREEDVDRADLAHTTDSYFYLLTDHFLRAAPDADVIQVHGYDDEDLEDRGIDVVLSNGTDDVDENLEHWGRRMGEAFGSERVALYPKDIRKYAATSNTIGRLTRLTRRGHFVHAELSASIRERLLEDVAPLATALRSSE